MNKFHGDEMHELHKKIDHLTQMICESHATQVVGELKCLNATAKDIAVQLKRIADRSEAVGINVTHGPSKSDS